MSTTKSVGTLYANNIRVGSSIETSSIYVDGNIEFSGTLSGTFGANPYDDLSVGTLEVKNRIVPMSTRGVNIGNDTGVTNQENFTIAIGEGAGYEDQSLNSIAIGSGAGSSGQGEDSIAIGSGAGGSNQGDYSIAIGINAATLNQHQNTIVINANSAVLNTSAHSAFYVKPIRDVTGNTNFTKTLVYNPTTGEIGLSG